MILGSKACAIDGGTVADGFYVELHLLTDRNITVWHEWTEIKEEFIEENGQVVTHGGQRVKQSGWTQSANNSPCAPLPAPGQILTSFAGWLPSVDYHNGRWRMTAKYGWQEPPPPGGSPPPPQYGQISMVVNFGNLLLEPDPTNPIVLAWDPDDVSKRQTRVKMNLGDATRSRGEVRLRVYLLHDPGALVFPVGDTLRHLYAEYRGFFPPDYNWEQGDAFLKLGRQANGDYRPPPPHDPNVLRDGALSRLGLVVYEGCNTANDNPDVGNLLSASLTLGVGYTVGWERTIYGGKYNPNNGHSGARVDNDPAHLWADEFWRAWCYDTNADGSPLNVMQAHDRVMEYVRSNCYASYRDPGETDPLGNMNYTSQASRSGVPTDGPTRDSIKGR